MEKRVLVYQAYGSQDIINQTIFSICSLLSVCKEPELIEIQIFTDKASELQEFFKGFSNIKIRKISLEQIDQLKGPLGFVHRVKVEILLAVSQEFKGPLFYSDGDTIYKSDPTDLFLKVNDRISLMHTDEGIIGKNKDPLSKKIAKFLKHKKFHVSGQDVAIGPSTEMWNAGFIGMSQKSKSLLPVMLELTDRLFNEYQKHIMEQLAVSFFLQTTTQILPVDNVVFHYWHNKEEFQASINQFLSAHNSAEAVVKNWDAWIMPPVSLVKKKKPALLKIKKILEPIKKMLGQ